jgi:hypothetical protein
MEQSRLFKDIRVRQS